MMTGFKARMAFYLIAVTFSVRATAGLTVIEQISNETRPDGLFVVESNSNAHQHDSQEQLIRRLQYENAMLRNELASKRSQNHSGIKETSNYLYPKKAKHIRKTYRVQGNSVTISNLELSELFLMCQNAKRLSITGYSDSRGNKKIRLQVARLRAESLKRKLIARGIPPYKINTRGLDGNYIASNATALGRMKNRRVTVVIE
jgi:inner membrane lipoprotein yiaD